VMARIAGLLEADAVVTDAGSTKQDVADIAHTCLKGSLDRFVPGHPIAGAELSGAAAASAELFQGKQVVLTPRPETSANALLRVRHAWQACGARVAEMSPAEHDRVFAAVSHLPHLLAFALVDDIAGKANAGQLFDYAASGFRDFTRIAGSHPEMWRDICLANREALLGELDAYREQLDRLRTALEQGDGAALERVFARASAARNAWAANKKTD
ncbi:MAG: prephenate dehydrogenase, partial [Burkholderiales bacterium]